MSTIYVIKEKIQLFSNEGKIIGAVSDEKIAKKYCRDMRTGRELYYEAVELDGQEMTDIPSEKIYRIVREVGWTVNKEDNLSEVYQDLMKISPNALFDEEDFLSITYASLRIIRLHSDYNGTSLSFWCFAKNAPAALGIMKRTLKDFDPSVLELGVYYPINTDNKELNRRLKRYNKKNKG